MGQIILNDIRIYAFHGCLDEEKKIGSDYIVNLEVETDMVKPSNSDDINDAVDYVSLNAIVKKEMSIRSKLLENVAKRIMDKIYEEYPNIELITISVSKQNPPIGGDVKEVSVRLKSSNRNL